VSNCRRESKFTASYENTGRGRRYSTGSVSDLNLREYLFIEAQVAHAPRTVALRCQIPIRRPFSSAVANRRFMDYSAVKNEFSRRDLAEKTRSCRLATQRPRGLEGCQKAIAHPVATARLSGWMIYRREPARLAHVILGRDRSGRKRNIAAW